MLETLRTSCNAAAARPIWTFKGQYLIDTDQWSGEVAKWDSGIVPQDPALKAHWDFIKGYGSIMRHDEEGASKSLILLAQDNARTGADTNPTNTILELELKAMVKLAQ